METNFDNLKNSNDQIPYFQEHITIEFDIIIT